MSSSCNITVYTLVSSIKSSQNAVTLKQGESQILSCMISPVNASNKQIEWKSSDEKIARVSTNGDGTAIVEAIASGTTVVTAITTDGTYCLPVALLRDNIGCSRVGNEYDMHLWPYRWYRMLCLVRLLQSILRAELSCMRVLRPKYTPKYSSLLDVCTLLNTPSR